MMGWLSSATGSACGGREPQGWEGVTKAGPRYRATLSGMGRHRPGQACFTSLCASLRAV